MVPYGDKEYSCLSKVVTVRTEKSIHSQGSKRNIETVINTHTCKISVAFFFPHFFSAVERRELQGFISFCLFLFMSVQLNLVSC